MVDRHVLNGLDLALADVTSAVVAVVDHFAVNAGSHFISLVMIGTSESS